MGWIRRELLDRFVFELLSKGIYVSRHSYSYRIMYGGRMVLGVHIYPGYKEIVVRLYVDSCGQYCEKVLSEVVSVLKELFPGYSVDIREFKSVIHGG